MENLEQNPGNKPEMTDEEQQLKQLEAVAEATRNAGVNDPSQTEG